VAVAEAKTCSSSADAVINAKRKLDELVLEQNTIVTDFQQDKIKLQNLNVKLATLNQQLQQGNLGY